MKLLLASYMLCIFIFLIIIPKIAQVTLRKALGLAEHLNSPFNISEYSEHPMVNSYIRLVKTVEPFETYFTEPGLLGQSLKCLFDVHGVGWPSWHSAYQIIGGLSFTIRTWQQPTNNSVRLFSVSCKGHSQHLDLHHWYRLQLPIRCSNSPS